MTESERMRDMVEKLLRRWAPSDVVNRPGATERELQRMEGRYGAQLPEDMRTFYTMVDGMEEDELDPLTQVRFWPISEVKTYEEEFPDRAGGGYAGFFLFADYLLWAHGYAIALLPGDPNTQKVVRSGGESPVQVASSFSDFILKYSVDPDSLL